MWPFLSVGTRSLVPSRIAPILSFLLLFNLGQACAEEAPAPNPSSGGNVTRSALLDFLSKTSPYEFWLTCIILVFGLVVLLLYLWGISKIEGRRPEDVSRSLIVIMVITGSLVLITVGYTTEQIAPAFGLFGTIIGYMLGRMSQPRPTGPSDGGTTDGNGKDTPPQPRGKNQEVQ